MVGFTIRCGNRIFTRLFDHTHFKRWNGHGGLKILYAIRLYIRSEIFFLVVLPIDTLRRRYWRHQDESRWNRRENPYRIWAIYWFSRFNGLLFWTTTCQLVPESVLLTSISFGGNQDAF